MDKLLTLVLALLASVGIYKLLKREETNIEVEEAKTDILDLPFLVQWLQRDDIKKLIKSNSNYYPVLIKGELVKNYLKKENIKNINSSDKENFCFQGVIDVSAGDKVLKLRKIYFSKIDEDLESMFKGKDMIILS